MPAIREWGKGLRSATPVVAPLLLLLLLQPTLAHSSVLSGSVVAVADGDTITVLNADRRQHRVRLAGIDAPEKAQPYGQASKRGLSDLVFGRNVDVHWVKQDRYGRLVGNVRVADSACKAAACPKTVDASYEQLRTGLAWWFRRYAQEQPKDEAARYEAAEQAARAGRLGLWKEPAPVPPWEWRKVQTATHLPATAIALARLPATRLTGIASNLTTKVWALWTEEELPIPTPAVQFERIKWRFRPRAGIGSQSELRPKVAAGALQFRRLFSAVIHGRIG